MSGRRARAQPEAAEASPKQQRPHTAYRPTRFIESPDMEEEEVEEEEIQQEEAIGQQQELEYDEGSPQRNSRRNGRQGGRPPTWNSCEIIMDGLYSLDSIQSAVTVHPLFKEHDSTDILEPAGD